MDNQKRLFRHDHPFLFVFLILGGMFAVLWGGIAFFLLSHLADNQQGDFFGSKEGIGIIELKGLLVSPEQVIETLGDFKRNPNIKAIVLRINSPGGTVGASQEIHKEILRTAEFKPIIASMGDVAASGGYYTAVAAQQIVANPGTITGSIGVILKFNNLQEIMEKIGYKAEVIKSGELKDIGSMSRAMTPSERDLLQALIDNVHNQFIEAVIEGRNLSREDVVRVADGRIFSGEQAQQLGLVDQLGNFTDAILLAAEKGGLDSSEPPHLIYPKEKEFSILRMIAGEAGQSTLQGLFGHFPALVYELPLFK